MHFLELINKRQSVRAYKPDDISDIELQQLLEAARLAPTASNRQPFKLIVIHSSGREVELRHIYDRDWFVQAPLVICICGTPNQAWVRKDGKNYCELDVAIAMDHLILAATALGLGTCWIADFDPKATREVLGLPDEVVPMVVTPLGYPNDQPRQKERRDLNELVSYNQW
ncbi:nitroreductase family protein [Chloroflexota bacterium]